MELCTVVEVRICALKGVDRGNRSCSRRTVSKEDLREVHFAAAQLWPDAPGLPRKSPRLIPTRHARSPETLVTGVGVRLGCCDLPCRMVGAIVPARPTCCSVLGMGAKCRTAFSADSNARYRDVLALRCWHGFRTANGASAAAPASPRPSPPDSPAKRQSHSCDRPKIRPSRLCPEPVR